MKSVLFLFALVLSAFAQDDYGRPSRQAGTTYLYFYDGSDNLEYICGAWGLQATSYFRRTDSTLTSIAVATNVGTATTANDHGLQPGNRVTVAGATADADLNGNYIIATAPTSTTFTFTTVNVSDATYNEATLYISTTAPRSTQAIWSIQKLSYTGTLLTRTQWAGGGQTKGNICDSRTSLAYY